ncbi:hypothetical protein ACFYZB_20030 [Streptomyces sp. NPDC001852]|uniref:hypothetical protein n=1 Tax=Streptomyces sp. NPDC001852 TaxID=3364619 RepID=UPI003695BB8C
MLRYMDLSVLAMGCALLLAGLGSRWMEGKGRRGADPHQGMRFFQTWLPLLMGLGMSGAEMPGLLKAPHPVVVIVDTLNLVLAVTVLVLALRAIGRWQRPTNLD